MPASYCVNVQDFGAVGLVLSTTGSIQAGSTVLTVESAAGWAVGSGIGITDASADASTGRTSNGKAALVTRVVRIDSASKQLHLSDAAVNNRLQRRGDGRR